MKHIRLTIMLLCTWEEGSHFSTEPEQEGHENAGHSHLGESSPLLQAFHGPSWGLQQLCIITVFRCYMLDVSEHMRSAVLLYAYECCGKHFKQFIKAIEHTTVNKARCSIWYCVSINWKGCISNWKVSVNVAKMITRRLNFIICNNRIFSYEHVPWASFTKMSSTELIGFSTGYFTTAGKPHSQGIKTSICDWVCSQRGNLPLKHKFWLVCFVKLAPGGV